MMLLGRKHLSKIVFDWEIIRIFSENESETSINQITEKLCRVLNLRYLLVNLKKKSKLSKQLIANKLHGWDQTGCSVFCRNDIVEIKCKRIKVEAGETI